MMRTFDPEYWFRRSVSCSEAMFTTLNRSFGEELEVEEQAAHALAGGVLRRGHSCGMLWGSALAAGARARRRHGEDPDVAGAVALFYTMRMVDEFKNAAGAQNCREIIGGNLSSLRGRLRYMFTAGFRNCSRLAVAWSRLAEQVMETGPEFDPAVLDLPPANCAMETFYQASRSAKLESDRSTVLVAGFAGGLGLSGNLCGALAAGIFAQGLKYYRGRSAPRDSFRQALLQEAGIGAGQVKEPIRLYRAFVERQGSDLCPAIIGREFSSIDEHSEFVEGGGCRELIGEVARLVASG